jgi:hypothetical protein
MLLGNKLRLRIHVRDAQRGHSTLPGPAAALPRVPALRRGPVHQRQRPRLCAAGARQQDPDTLFFSRRLAMEGDTELGLLVKNTIDAIELPVFHLERFKPAQVLERLKAKFRPR